MKIACITPVDHLDNVKNILESKGKVFYLKNPSKSEAIELIAKNNCDTIFTNPNKQTFYIGEDFFNLGCIKTICTASTGLNHIDIADAEYHDVKILSLTKDYDFIKTIPATAEHAFALTMSLIRNIPSSFDAVKRGEWNYEPYIGRQLKDLQFGIVGYGRLGKMFAKYAQAFSEKEILIYDPYVSESNCSLEQMFEKCDVISLHVHVSNETKGMINKNLFKKPCYLINTSRGEIVNELDIISGINNKSILGYATDVVSDEFGNTYESPIIKASKNHDNVIVTPHIGGMTIESQNQAYEWAANKL